MALVIIRVVIRVDTRVVIRVDNEGATRARKIENTYWNVTILVFY